MRDSKSFLELEIVSAADEERRTEEQKKEERTLGERTLGPLKDRERPIGSLKGRLNR